MAAAIIVIGAARAAVRNSELRNRDPRCTLFSSNARLITRDSCPESRSDHSAFRASRNLINTALVVEAVAELCINLAWEIPVESAEGQAVVVFDAAIGYVERGERCGEVFAEIFAE